MPTPSLFPEPPANPAKAALRPETGLLMMPAITLPPRVPDYTEVLRFRIRLGARLIADKLAADTLRACALQARRRLRRGEDSTAAGAPDEPGAAERNR